MQKKQQKEMERLRKAREKMARRQGKGPKREEAVEVPDWPEGEKNPGQLTGDRTPVQPDVDKSPDQE